MKFADCEWKVHLGNLTITHQTTYGLEDVSPFKKWLLVWYLTLNFGGVLLLDWKYYIYHVCLAASLLLKAQIMPKVQKSQVGLSPWRCLVAVRMPGGTRHVLISMVRSW